MRTSVSKKEIDEMVDKMIQLHLSNADNLLKDRQGILQMDEEIWVILYNTWEEKLKYNQL